MLRSCTAYRCISDINCNIGSYGRCRFRATNKPLLLFVSNSGMWSLCEQVCTYVYIICMYVCTSVSSTGHFIAGEHENRT